MCNFLSALVLRDGRVICDPEHTDSHEDLVDNEGLRDDGRGFVRVEFTPGEQIDDPKTWTLRLDEESAPDWWDTATQDRVRQYLIDMVSGHIVRESRKVLIGGWWILASGVEVRKVCGARVYAMCRTRRGSRRFVIVEGASRWCRPGRSRHMETHLCHFRTVPAKRECLEAIWSEGRACRTCWVECYRRGWTKKRVDEDNAKRVSERWKNDPEWNRKVER